jgi:hypothetical protein
MLVCVPLLAVSCPPVVIADDSWLFCEVYLNILVKNRTQLANRPAWEIHKLASEVITPSSTSLQPGLVRHM